MEDYSSNGCLQININVNLKNNNSKNLSVPQNSVKSENIQINININTNNFQESSTLVKIDQTQQTDDLQYELKQENQKSDELDEFGTQIPKNSGKKSFSHERKHEDKTKYNNPIDNNNESKDNLPTISDQDIIKNNENNDKQKHSKENQMEMNENKKHNELETNEINLKSSNDLQSKNSSELVNNNGENINNFSDKICINERSDSNNSKLLSDEKPETKNKESHCYESNVNMRERDNLDNNGNVKYKIKR